MATVINAGTTTSTALNITTDTTGVMAIQTSGANAISISNAQVVTLTNPLPANSGGTGITSLGNGIPTFLGTPSSANLLAAVTDETGTGSLVFSISPALTGTPTAPTAANGTNTTQIATTAFVNSAVTIATGSLGTMSTQNANAVAITGGTVAGITDLAVADGGTGSSTLAANAVLLGNGTSALQTVAPGSSGNLLVSNGTTWQSAAPSTAVPVIGQTWTSYGSGDRASGGTYTNTTGKTIQVFGNFGCNGGGGAEMYVDGNLIAKWSAQFNGCGGYSSPMGALVPPGSTYKVITTAGGGFISWWELR